MAQRKKKYLSTSLLVGTAWILAVPVQAQINIEPIVTTEYRYDSNFWLSEQDEVAVGTIMIRPGVKINYDTGKTQIDLDTFIEGYIYHDYDTPPEGVSDASDDNYVGAYIDFSGSNQVTDRVNLGLDETFSYTRDAAQSDDFYDSIDREAYYINRFSPNAYYDFGNKFGVDLRYQHLLTEYQDNGEDSTQHKGQFNLDYNFTETSKIFVSYELWTRDYDQNSSSYLSNRAKLNYEYQFNFFSVSAGAGYHNRSFDEDGLDDLDQFSWNVELAGQNPPLPEGNPKSYMILGLSQDINDAGSGNSYYTATKAEVELGHIFQERIVTSLEGYVQNSNYDLFQGAASDRDDTTYSVSGSLGYKFLRRCEVNFELGYKDRNSDIAGESYSDTYGLVSLDLGLDLGVL